MQSLGINIGSSSVKVTMLEDGNVIWSEVISHEGNFQETLKDILSKNLFGSLIVVFTFNS